MDSAQVIARFEAERQALARSVFVLATAIAALWGAELDRSAASELVFLLHCPG